MMRIQSIEGNGAYGVSVEVENQNGRASVSMDAQTARREAMRLLTAADMADSAQGKSILVSRSEAIKAILTGEL